MMPAIRNFTEARTTSLFFDNTFSLINTKSRYSPYQTSDIAGSTASWGFVDPSHLFVVPPPTMIVPSQAAVLFDTPVGKYLTGITLDSSYAETEAAKTTKVAKSSKTRKEKAKSKENVAQVTEVKKTSRSKRKDPNYIPRPKNAFMIFRCELYKRTVDEAASATIVFSPPSGSTATSSSSSESKPSKICQNEFSKRAASEWHNLPLESRKVFERKATEDKKRIMLLHVEKQREAERAQRELDFQPVWHPEEYEVMNHELPLRSEQRTFTPSVIQDTKEVEIIDLTQDDDDEICDNIASSSSQTFRSSSRPNGTLDDNFGVDLSPRSYSASTFDEIKFAPQLISFSPSPAPNFSSSSQLHMPIPSIPIPSSISNFGYGSSDCQNASTFEDPTHAQSYTYASSSSPSSSAYSAVSNLPALDTDAPSPVSELGPITPTSDSESIAKQLFVLMDLDLASENQLPSTLQSDFEEWLPTELPFEDLYSGSDVEVSVQDLNIDQWCW
ncbi:hypothetical protein CPB83DRAFT_304656 [Crepidotus variabilis]|uniref:HMG box domain-containing protein n=1 Tax=Crepidotus variabilis TaxID=179855 RepID=A0A9P6JPW9_9AGAR|nr:hypothetical protein CPB83DRAFT_304656 [Crepidotus variabilis]